MTQRILVIDDDEHVTSTLRRGLAYEGYAVDVANSSRRGLTLARERAPDLVILDMMLPDLDGLEVLDRLRADGTDTPVVILSARDEPDDQAAGLDRGADDYVPKPFTFDVLTARIRALLRRRTVEAPELFRFADLTLDAGTREATRGHRAIVLTATEYEVLRQFMLHPRRVLAKHFLMDRIWGYGGSGNSNLLEVYVKQLRKKMEQGGEPRLIHTFRGVGYVLREV